MPRSAEPGPSTDRGPERRTWRPGPLALRALLILGVLGLAVWANLHAADHDLVREATRRFGYPGILLAAGISGFNLVVPIPVIAFYPFFLDVGLQPVPTVLVIALGMTLGDLLGYLLGRAARGMVRPREDGVIQRLEALRERHPYLPLAVMFLYAAFAPAPNELLVLPLAFLRYPVAGIFGAVLVGNLIFNGLVAFGVVQVFALI
ncbi:MAG: hypothetical protein ACOCVZ_00075 [Gemmatimonadota bacterium]